MDAVSRISSRRQGFTLVEMLVSLAAAASLLTTVLLSSVALQRSFYWSSEYSATSVAQARVVDFITRDLRGALTVTMPPGTRTITMELPDRYSSYDAQGNPTSAPVDPAIVDGRAEYGNPALPVVVTYYVAEGRLIRQQVIQATNQISASIIGREVTDFTASFINSGSAIRFSATFGGNTVSGSPTVAGSMVSAKVTPRAPRL
jgi:prepilin-type N-terminal cleavage/methylation domain-containing protein